VVDAGAVGGDYGAHLAHAGDGVVFLARGANRQATEFLYPYGKTYIQTLGEQD
jgi:ketopantoate reductase